MLRVLVNLHKKLTKAVPKNIQVVKYDPLWPEQFSAEAEKVKTILGDNCITIHHVGSTSVPKLPAKPIIDMIPVVNNILSVDDKRSEFEALGYEVRGEFGIPFRRFFKKRGSLGFHLHIFQEGNPEIERHVGFRDYLRDHPKMRDQYARLKQRLGFDTNNIHDYTQAKAPFIQYITECFGFDQCRITHPVNEHEWNGYHHIMRDVLFKPVGIVYDPEHWTLTDPNYKKFVLIKGTQVIGAAMIALWDQDKCILRTFGIEHESQHQGVGSAFLALLETWARHQHRTVIYLHSRLEAVRFYKRHGYSEQGFDDPVPKERHDRCINLSKML